MRSSASPLSRRPVFEPEDDNAATGDPLGVILRESDHTYWVGDEQILGTWETFRELALYDATYYTDAGRERGQRVHHRTAAMDRGGADLPPILADELGYCDSWRRLFTAWDLVVLLCERPLWDPVRRVAGTIDRIALVRRPGFERHVGVLDLKSGAEEPIHRFQLAVYDLLAAAWLRSLVNDARRRELQALPRVLYAVYLRADGRFPKVRRHRFDPRVHALIAAAQLKRTLAPAGAW